MGDLEDVVACGGKMLNGVLERKGPTSVGKKVIFTNQNTQVIRNQEILTIIHRIKFHVL